MKLHIAHISQVYRGRILLIIFRGVSLHRVDLRILYLSHSLFSFFLLLSLVLLARIRETLRPPEYARIAAIVISTAMYSELPESSSLISEIFTNNISLKTPRIFTSSSLLSIPLFEKITKLQN